MQNITRSFYSIEQLLTLLDALHCAQHQLQSVSQSLNPTTPEKSLDFVHNRLNRER